ncbi:MAG: biotin--[acetyl-CoA-carboxylase] ligase [Gemmatimonadota bacterium]|nr:biotin--[acetyl-CoA-carboxylase] ligase [Gemmatimonadota bacterium]
MIVYTDSIEFADSLFSNGRATWGPATFTEATRLLGHQLFGDQPVSCRELDPVEPFTILFATKTASQSQYDILTGLGGAGTALPGAVLCLAGSGRGFHGQRGRPWSASEGNVHLSAHFTLPVSAHTTVPDFTALAAVSVVDTIDGIDDLHGRAGIKWVNDILIDGAKVCGILAGTDTSGAHVSRAVIGIGLNVENVPTIAPTPFVPKVAALRTFTSDAACNRAHVLTSLLAILGRNYLTLIGSNPTSLVDRYRDRSLIIGSHVTICADSSDDQPVVLASGRAEALGDQLELYIGGVKQPFAHGRVILDPRR